MALMRRLGVFLLETSIEIDELLSAWDKNSDGYLTIEDCRSGLRELGIEADDEEMEDLFEFFQQPEQEDNPTDEARPGLAVTAAAATSKAAAAMLAPSALLLPTATSSLAEPATAALQPQTGAPLLPPRFSAAASASIHATTTTSGTCAHASAALSTLAPAAPAVRATPSEGERPGDALPAGNLSGPSALVPSARLSQPCGETIAHPAASHSKAECSAARDMTASAPRDAAVTRIIPKLAKSQRPVDDEPEPWEMLAGAMLGKSQVQRGVAEREKAERAEKKKKKIEKRGQDPKSEVARAEGAKAEEARAEGAKAEGAKAEGAKAEAARAGGAKAEGAKAEGAKAEAARAEGARAGGVKAGSVAAAKVEGLRKNAAKDGLAGNAAKDGMAGNAAKDGAKDGTKLRTCEGLIAAAAMSGEACTTAFEVAGKATGAVEAVSDTREQLTTEVKQEAQQEVPTVAVGSARVGLAGGAATSVAEAEAKGREGEANGTSKAKQKEAKEVKEAMEAKEAKEVKEAMEAKEAKEAMEAKEVKEAMEAKEAKEAKVQVQVQAQPQTTPTMDRRESVEWDTSTVRSLGDPQGKRSGSKKEQEGKQLGLPTEPSQLEEGGMKEAGWARRKLGREDVSRAREDVSQFAAAVASVGSTGDSSDDDASARAGSPGSRLGKGGNAKGEMSASKAKTVPDSSDEDGESAPTSVGQKRKSVESARAGAVGEGRRRQRKRARAGISDGGADEDSSDEGSPEETAAGEGSAGSKAPGYRSVEMDRTAEKALERVGALVCPAGYEILPELPQLTAGVMKRLKVAHKFTDGWSLGTWRGKNRNGQHNVYYHQNGPESSGARGGLIWALELKPEDYGPGKTWAALRQLSNSEA